MSVTREVARFVAIPKLTEIFRRAGGFAAENVEAILSGKCRDWDI
jgi:hypothetical protein